MRHALYLAPVTAAILLTPSRALSQEVEMVIAGQEPLLRDYDDSDQEYYKLQIAGTVSYYHQRMIGEAFVERDFRRYQFDVPSGELVEETIRWRPDLPPSADALITQEQAESVAPGEVRYSVLYFIDPDSVVFPIAPTPKNVCWVVRSTIGDRPVLTIVDAITGQNLGRGTPPPAEGFSLTGPEDEPNCADPWIDHCINAYVWFSAMGYETSPAVFPPTSLVGQFVASYDLAVFYELAHGGSTLFNNGCPDDTTAADIEAWLTDYANVPFAFVGSFFGLCDTSDGTFAYEFRKGLNTGAAVVGYCEMSEPYCEIPCWPLAVDWQSTLFSYLADGGSVEYAFDSANLAYPPCADNACMRWAATAA